MVGKLPTAPLRRQVERLARPYSLDRYVGHVDDVAGGGREYDRDAVVAELYVYEPSGGESFAEAGVLEQGSMTAVCTTDQDVQLRDRFDYGDRRYEVVEPITRLPSNNPTVLQLSLDRVTEQATDVREFPD